MGAAADAGEEVVYGRSPLRSAPRPRLKPPWDFSGRESSGGSTVTFFNAGAASMDWMWKRDPNAWHFMSLPSGIAMGDNGFFSTCPGVYDANHNGGDPFTGPTHWNADTSI